MFLVTMIVLSLLLLTVTGCATSSPPFAAKQEAGKKNFSKKVVKQDQERLMNEESMEAVR